MISQDLKTERGDQMKKYTRRYKGFKIEKKDGEPYRVAMDYPAKSLMDCRIEGQGILEGSLYN